MVEEAMRERTIDGDLRDMAAAEAEKIKLMHLEDSCKCDCASDHY